MGNFFKMAAGDLDIFLVSVETFIYASEYSGLVLEYRNWSHHESILGVILNFYLIYR